MGDMRRILIIDDDAAVTNYLMVFLMQTELFEPVVVNDSREAPGLLASEHIDLVLLDMDMPGLSGLDILRQIRDGGLNIPVIILTGVSDVDLAVRAMKLGAFDYLTKPADDDKLLETIDRALEHHALNARLTQLPDGLSRDGLEHAAAFEGFISTDPGVIRLFHQAERMAAADFPVFIQGERGTGKESLARAIHSSGPWRDGPFIAVDAAAIDPYRFAADLFGQVRDFRGACEDKPGFLEQAANGTLFLNSIECLSIPVQVRLRRVISDGEYYRENSTEIRRIEIRFVVSTTRDLASDDYRDSFSRDLLYHLMVNCISIPALRERPGDIPLLSEKFLREESESTGVPCEGFLPEFFEALMRYDFPGNVEELRAIVRSCLASCSGAPIGVDCLPFYVKDRIGAGARPAAGEPAPRPLAQIKREHAARAVEYYSGDRTLAAHALGIPPEELEDLLR
jgi:DNA-binding NtrC family response regulator